jgi:hypothetical protein
MKVIGFSLMVVTMAALTCCAPARPISKICCQANALLIILFQLIRRGCGRGLCLKPPASNLFARKATGISCQILRILRRSAPVKFYMTIKALEIRDEGTFIAVLAIQMLADNPVALY